MSDRPQYRKDWIVSSGIARSLICLDAGDRLPTIDEYMTVFDCSRGIVQTAIASLESGYCVRLSKKGKLGTFLLEKDDKKLFAAAQLKFVTGSMPAPFNIHFAGLATGIWEAMDELPVPFTFAFMQGAKNRIEALDRGIYDFTVVTEAAALDCVKKGGKVDLALRLDNSEYSRPYMLFFKDKSNTEIRDGMSIAVDPTSNDQWKLTDELCRGKHVTVVKQPFIATIISFYMGEVDCIVFRANPGDAPDPLQQPAMSINQSMLFAPEKGVPINSEIAKSMQLPVILTHKDNFMMADILQKYISAELIGTIQDRVRGMLMSARFS